MTERELEILEIIRKDPFISQEELASRLMITRSGVAAHIHNLMNKGYIKGKGYYVNETDFVSVIGGSNIDIIGAVSSTMNIEDSNPGNISYSYGGAGYNIAASLTKMNIPNYFITVYGDDVNGDRFIRHCRENNINVQCCEMIPGEHTSSFMYINDANGKMHIGINDSGIYRKMTTEFVTKYLDKINSSQYCILDINLPNETLKDLYRRVTVPIFVKMTSTGKAKRVLTGNQKIRLLVASPLELKGLLEYYNEPFTGIDAAMEYLHRHNIDNIAVFSVEDGLYFSGEDQHIHIKKSLPKVVNSAGACTMLLSTIVWGLSKNFSWSRIMRYAYAAIGICVQSRLPVPSSLTQENIIAREKEMF